MNSGFTVDRGSGFGVGVWGAGFKGFEVLGSAV